MVPLGSAQWGYAVHPELGMSALRRDERTEAINNTAARNALVTGVLVLTAVTVYYGHLRSALFLLPS